MSRREVLVGVAENIANAHHDGHLTLMKFTTGWKVMFGTPNDLRAEARMLRPYRNLHEALEALLVQETA